MTNDQGKKEKKEVLKNGTPMSFIGRLLLGLYMVILPVILIYLVITFWPKPNTQNEILITDARAFVAGKATRLLR